MRTLRILCLIRDPPLSLYISITRTEIITSNIIAFCKPQLRSRFLHAKVSVSDVFIITLSSACLTFISPWTTRLRFMSPSLVTSLNKMWVGVFEVVPSRDGRQGSLLLGPPSKACSHKHNLPASVRTALVCLF